MDDEKSSNPPAVQLSVELQLPAGDLVQLPSAQLGNELAVLPQLDGHAVDTEGLSYAGLVSAEVTDYVFFEHQATISMLYLEHNTALPASSYADVVETMGDRIKMLRHSKGWTQQQLGDQVGVSKVAVYQWEVGTTSDIKLKTFLRLVETLGTNPHYLLFGHEAPRTQPRKRSQS
jgi:DNA-binding XRE family transcriptional regulator